MASAAAVRGRPRRVVVSGDSMRPTFEPGDRLLVLPTAAVREGDVVALRDPTRPDRVLVKRVMRFDTSGVHVRGDNDAASTDSRHFGPVLPSAVVGRVVYRYHPPGRSGRLTE